MITKAPAIFIGALYFPTVFRRRLRRSVGPVWRLIHSRTPQLLPWVLYLQYKTKQTVNCVSSAACLSESVFIQGPTSVCWTFCSQVHRACEPLKSRRFPTKEHCVVAVLLQFRLASVNKVQQVHKELEATSSWRKQPTTVDCPLLRVSCSPLSHSLHRNSHWLLPLIFNNHTECQNASWDLVYTSSYPSMFLCDKKQTTLQQDIVDLRVNNQLEHIWKMVASAVLSLIPKIVFIMTYWSQGKAWGIFCNLDTRQKLETYCLWDRVIRFMTFQHLGYSFIFCSCCYCCSVLIWTLNFIAWDWGSRKCWRKLQGRTFLFFTRFYLKRNMNRNEKCIFS